MRMPSEIQTAYDRLSDGKPTVAVARALADIEGNLGEAYAATEGETLYVFSKRLGESHKEFQFPLAELDGLDMEDDRPFLFLNIHGDQGVLRLKFGGMDRDDVTRFVDLWQGLQDEAEAESDDRAAGPPPVPVEAKKQPPPVPTDDAADDVPALTAFVGFAAALQTMIEVDGSVDNEETRLLNRMIDRPEVVTNAIKYLRVHGPDKLRMALSIMLDRKQKLCLIANLLELSMVDGYLKGSEQELLRAYVDALGIANEEYQEIYEVLGLKNNLSIFTI